MSEADFHVVGSEDMMDNSVTEKSECCLECGLSVAEVVLLEDTMKRNR